VSLNITWMMESSTMRYTDTAIVGEQRDA